MNQPALTCSVVMVSYNTGEALFAAIKLALAQNGLQELIVVSNGNPPEHEARLMQLQASQPKLRVVSGQGNVGFAAGCNLGAKYATGAYVLLLNPDVMLVQGALQKTMEALEADPQAMLASCHLINPDGSTQRGCIRNLLTPKAVLAEILMLPRFLGVERLNGHRGPVPQGTQAVPAISGAYMMLRLRDFQLLGGLDEHYFLHVEDLDLCWRVKQAARTLIFVPSVKLVHLLSTSEAPGRVIERHKANGFHYYFNRHYKTRLAKPLLWLLHLLIELRYVLKLLCAKKPRLCRKKRHGNDLALRKLMLLLDSYASQSPDSFFAGKTVMVTGARSPLGMCVTGMLLAAGANVCALSRNPDSAYEHENLRWLKGDLRAVSLPETACAPGLMIHCAPLWLLPPLVESISHTGSKHVVAFGSTSVFGKLESSNIYERATVHRLQHAEEELVQQATHYGLRWTLLRPTLIYGGGLDQNISRLARAMRMARICLLYPPASGLRQPVHAQDLAAASLAVLRNEAAANKAYNLSGGETLTYREMVERIATAMGRKPRIVYSRALPLALNVAGRMLPWLRINGEMAKRQNRDLVFSHDDAAHDFHYTPRPFLSNPRSDLPL